MDYYTTQASPHAFTSSEAERRASPRKRLQCRVTIGLGAGKIVQGYTTEISIGGLGILIPTALSVGELCGIRFDLMVNGEAFKILGTAKVANCSCSGLDGFRVGMQLTVRDPRALQAVTEYLQ